jgi:geranylgeranyl diphosphate synthase type II
MTPQRFLKEFFPVSQINLQSRLASLHRKVDSALDRWLPSEKRRPVTLHRAMRYSLFAGGKRMRPILCLGAAEACGGKIGAAMPAACALECIHTYSLIHDDLPCMDDDELRRGRPTTHKVFGEAVAVLAGDALLTIAFEILAETRETKRHRLPDFFVEMTKAAGSLFLIGGQVADIEAEGRKTSPEELLFIHRGKTAAMIAASLKLGAMSANASASDVKALEKFGENLGLAFQIVDDILDITQTSDKLGKSAGKDVAAGKATFPAVFGMEESRKEAARLTKKARKSLEPLGERAPFLHAMADQLLGREF